MFRFSSYRAQENSDATRLKNLYREFEQEDRVLAQADIENFDQNLAREDAA